VTAVRFEVPGDPTPQGSMRAVVGGDGKAHVISDNVKTGPWRTQVAWAARQAWSGAPTTAAVSVTAVFWIARPASVSEKKRPAHTVKPDVDKLTRAILDALTGVVYRDDSQVDHIEATKKYVNTWQPHPIAAITVEVQDGNYEALSRGP